MSPIKRLLLITAALLLAAAPALGEDGRGEELFDLCAQCHGAEGGGNEVALAPPIAGLSDWYVKEQLLKFRSGIRGLHPDDLGGLRMYPMSLSLRDDADLEAVADYVASLPPAAGEPTLQGGDASRGKILYAPCTACHGAKAEGKKDLGGPNLEVSADWYMLKQLQHFKSGVRGSDPRDTTGMRMRPMAMILADEQAMKDVISYILTLR
jgi:cytochrome c oxidase subunit 2